MRSSLEYADVVWDGCSECDSNLFVSLQIEGARVVTGALKGTNRVSLLKDLSWVELSVRRKIHKLTLMYKMVFTHSSLSCPCRSSSLLPLVMSSVLTHSLLEILLKNAF